MTKFGEGGYKSMNWVLYIESEGAIVVGTILLIPALPQYGKLWINDEFRAWELSHIGWLETYLENNKDGLFF